MWTILASYPGLPFVFSVQLENVGRGGMLCVVMIFVWTCTIWDVVCTDTHTLINARMWGIISPATTFQVGETMQGMCSSLKHTRMKICQGIKSSCSICLGFRTSSHTHNLTVLWLQTMCHKVSESESEGPKFKSFLAPLPMHPSLKCLVHPYNVMSISFDYSSTIYSIRYSKHICTTCSFLQESKTSSTIIPLTPHEGWKPVNLEVAVVSNYYALTEIESYNILIGHIKVVSLIDCYSY